MSRLLLVLSVFCLVVAGGVDAAELKEPLKLHGIKGTDDRHLVERVVPPWSAIGRVNRRTGGFCTGTLIAPRKVLTAAHCLWNRRTRNWLPSVSLHFVSGYSKGEFIAHARVTVFRVSSSYQPGQSVRDNLPFDWAVLTLDRVIDNLVGTIPLGKIDGSNKIIQAGYSKDKPHILTLNKVCNVLNHDQKSNLIYHDCDATKGDSGAPILQEIDQKHHVIGMHVATAGKGDSALGVAILHSSNLNWD